MTTRQPLAEESQQKNEIIYHRTGGKNNADFVLKDIYKYFKKKTKLCIPYSTFVAICKEFNEFVIDEMVFKGTDFYMPARLGLLSVRKKKAVPYLVDNEPYFAHLPIDYKKTKELWSRNPEAKARGQLVRFLNKHTDGFKYRFHWDKSTAPVVNISVYQFKCTRTNKREKLAKALMSDKKPAIYELPISVKP